MKSLIFCRARLRSVLRFALMQFPEKNAEFWRMIRLLRSRSGVEWSEGEAVAEHRRPAYRFGFRCFVLEHIPVLGELVVLNAVNVGSNPGRRVAVFMRQKPRATGAVRPCPPLVTLAIRRKRFGRAP